jgi:TATA-box binding protein (TBP) (component of TFIID and TFIIIB)
MDIKTLKRFSTDDELQEQAAKRIKQFDAVTNIMQLCADHIRIKPNIVNGRRQINKLGKAQLWQTRIFNLVYSGSASAYLRSTNARVSKSARDKRIRALKLPYDITQAPIVRPSMYTVFTHTLCALPTDNHKAVDKPLTALLQTCIKVMQSCTVLLTASHRTPKFTQMAIAHAKRLRVYLKYAPLFAAVNALTMRVQQKYNQTKDFVPFEGNPEPYPRDVLERAYVAPNGKEHVHPGAQFYFNGNRMPMPVRVIYTFPAAILNLGRQSNSIFPHAVNQLCGAKSVADVIACMNFFRSQIEQSWYGNERNAFYCNSIRIALLNMVASCELPTCVNLMALAPHPEFEYDPEGYPAANTSKFHPHACCTTFATGAANVTGRCTKFEADEIVQRVYDFILDHNANEELQNLEPHLMRVRRYNMGALL